ncbi:hypothetical protein CJP74_07755 [Psittacicella melopsittaci]|uniref:Uncharacterized protein n=1 Tax=Psittacicella melopsittaci TaxID=2028576 RepID=A0A3A1Y1C9_9GAMM|nr:hypothetical protein [Psittacicella melopsittaci]RIY31261.1 hypothetical protein CJP74_07755 [Psittacicella melopsittaci]
MKIKSVLLSVLVATTAFATMNANASTKDPATAYSDYYKMAAAQKAAMNAQTKTLEVNGQTINATVTSGNSGTVNVVLGDQNATAAYYTVGNVTVKAPSSMDVVTINSALKALNIDSQISQVGYVMTQANMAKKS